MDMFDDVREHVIFYREDGDLKVSCKIGKTWLESVLASDEIQRLKDVLDGKSYNSKNLIDFTWR